MSRNYEVDYEAERSLRLDRNLAYGLDDARAELDKFAKGKDRRLWTSYAVLVGLGVLAWYDKPDKADNYVYLLSAAWIAARLWEEWKHGQLLDRYVQHAQFYFVMDRLGEVERLLRQLMPQPR
jgi:hypothetical protein